MDKKVDIARVKKWTFDFFVEKEQVVIPTGFAHSKNGSE